MDNEGVSVRPWNSLDSGFSLVVGGSVVAIELRLRPLSAA
jgi:hypothetical protein